MTDKQTLFLYRIRQAEETLSDAEKMLQENLSPRSITNRAYYSMFYATLALFIDQGISLKTSKHSGIISILDEQFIHTDKIDKYYSKILHRMFNMRQEGDYKEMVEISRDDAIQGIEHAQAFLNAIKEFIKSGK
jgi:uncharacterized protein (UPF0332 family)